MGNEYLFEFEQQKAERLRPSELAKYETGMFHVTQHAIDDLYCFSDRTDMKEFLDRFARHLSIEPQRDPVRRELFPHMRSDVSLVAFCLLENHYHLILRQYSLHGTRRLMNSVLSSYSKYFNRKYGRVGSPIFREPFTATKINDSSHGRAALAYVTLNHEVKMEDYEFCSYDFYVGRRRCPEWLDPASGLWFFDGKADEFKRHIQDEGRAALDRKIARREERSAESPTLRRARTGRASHVRRAGTLG